jgi:hypothetical protein
MRYAIAPRGVGKMPGARVVREGWPLADGETFVVEAETVEGLVLAEDEQSLRAGTAQELAPRRLVAKSLIVERLHAAGLLAAARSALDADLYARERWYAPDKPSIYADDAEALALLTAIGAEAGVVLAE